MARSREPRPRFALRDLLGESLASLLSRPGRALLTILGTVLGIGAIVATLGIAKTAGNQIVTRFDALAATFISIQDAGDVPGSNSPTGAAIPWDAEDRLTRLNGVVRAGTLTDVFIGADTTRSVPLNDPMARTEFRIALRAATPGLLETVRGELRAGRFFDAGHSRRGDRIAVLGTGAARTLGIDRVDHQPAIFVGDELLIVAGILDDVARRPELLEAIIIPNGTAREVFGLERIDEVYIRTELGATALIAVQAPVALSPNDPLRLAVEAPPEPRAIRSEVAEDVNALFLVLGGVSLLIGAIGIANVTMVSVLERVGEVGLRRAVGAARRHIAAQFLVESAGIGFIGGVVGASAGILVVVGVAAFRDWTPVIEPWIPLSAPLLGLVVGLVAGLYPALKAAALEPIEALRAGV